MNLKIYRKLLILIVLTVGLFFAASSSPASAEATDCCSDCWAGFERCAMYTCQYGGQACVQTFCYPQYYACADLCYPMICY